MPLECSRLKHWFFLFRRRLPWRQNPSPYAVWISEVMLQQTQVAVVIPYFEKWMHLFPTVHALARAPLQQVIKVWEGLGYYSRARHLHEGARYLVDHHGGELPESPQALEKVKGIGPYTVGAIRSFAFKQRAAAVDGNVLRVLSRLFAIEDPIDQPQTRRQIEAMAQSILPEQEPWIVMEALIELGALICKKKPSCGRCPLKMSCLARQRHLETTLPITGKKTPLTSLHRLVAVVQSEGKVLLKKGEKGKVMADLWEFPYIETVCCIEAGEPWRLELESKFSLSLVCKQKLPNIVHGFTRYKAFLYPHLWWAAEALSVPSYEWVPLEELLEKPFSSGHRRILKNLLDVTIRQINSP